MEKFQRRRSLSQLVTRQRVELMQQKALTNVYFVNNERDPALWLKLPSFRNGETKQGKIPLWVHTPRNDCMLA